MSEKALIRPSSHKARELAAPRFSTAAAIAIAAFMMTTTALPAHAQSGLPPMPEDFGKAKSLPPMPNGYGQIKKLPPMPDGYGSQTRRARSSLPSTAPLQSTRSSTVGQRFYPTVQRPGRAVAQPVITPRPVITTPQPVVTPHPAVTPQPVITPVAPTAPAPVQTAKKQMPTPQMPKLEPQAPMKLPSETPKRPAPMMILPKEEPMMAEAPKLPEPEPMKAPAPAAPAPVTPAPAPHYATNIPSGNKPNLMVRKPVPQMSPDQFEYPDEPFELPIRPMAEPTKQAAIPSDEKIVLKKPDIEAPMEAAPEIIAADAEVDEETKSIFDMLVSADNKPAEMETDEVDQATIEYGARPEGFVMPKLKLPSEDVEEVPVASAEDTVVVESEVVDSVEVEPVEVAMLPELSAESKAIIEKIPSGIDSPKVMKTPKPIVIKRNDPNAGVINTIDYRAHEELGLKIEMRKSDPNVHQLLEDAYQNLMRNRYAVAEGYYQEVLNAEPKNEMAMFGMATTLHKSGDLNKARDYYGKLLENNPTHREGLINFMALIGEEAPQEALAELARLEENNPDFSPVPAQQASVYNRIGEPEKAAQKMAQALKLEPDNMSYKYNLAIMLDKLGQKEEAANLYVELIEDYHNGASIPGDMEMIKNRVVFLSSKNG